MSLNRTLERLFRAIRCEVARNPAFAGELEAALREYRPRIGPARPLASLPKPVHLQQKSSRGFVSGNAQDQSIVASDPGKSSSDFPDDAIMPAPSPAGTKPVVSRPVKPLLNPIAFARREGVDGLRGELLSGEYDESTLRVLLEEHNLDPAGAARDEGFAELVERLTEQARRRLERDQKLFAY